jgi:hypothetical protein
VSIETEAEAEMWWLPFKAKPEIRRRNKIKLQKKITLAISYKGSQYLQVSWFLFFAFGVYKDKEKEN